MFIVYAQARSITIGPVSLAWSGGQEFDIFIVCSRLMGSHWS